MGRERRRSEEWGFVRESNTWQHCYKDNVVIWFIILWVNGGDFPMFYTDFQIRDWRESNYTTPPLSLSPSSFHPSSSHVEVPNIASVSATHTANFHCIYCMWLSPYVPFPLYPVIQSCQTHHILLLGYLLSIWRFTYFTRIPLGLFFDDCYIFFFKFLKKNVNSISLIYQRGL